jgi:Na+-transporting methylmalonyl-CoA/oxaloacetate decarboxylase gamma subunit
MQKLSIKKILIKIFVFVTAFAVLFTFFGATNSADAQRIYGETGVITECPTNGLNRFIPGRSPSGQTGSNISYNPDVACTCRVDQCRLSTARNIVGSENTSGLTSNLLFTCIDGVSDPSANQERLGPGAFGIADQFMDTYYYREASRETVKGVSCTPEHPILHDLNITNDGKTKISCCKIVNVIGNPSGLECIDLDVTNEVNFGQGLNYMDIFSVDVSRQLIPAGSVCRINPNDPQGVASWYYPGYFDVMRGVTPGDPGSSTGNFFFGGVCGSLYPNTGDVIFVQTDLFGRPVGGTRTFFGCLPNSINGVTAFVVRLATGLGIALTFLIILINLIQIMSKSTNPDAVAEHRKKMQSAIITLIGLILSITILSIFGIQIIGFGNEGFGGTIFRFFVGG